MYGQKIAELQTSLALAHSQGAGLREKEAELQRTKHELEQMKEELTVALQRIEVREGGGGREERKKVCMWKHT